MLSSSYVREPVGSGDWRVSFLLCPWPLPVQTELVDSRVVVSDPHSHVYSLKVIPMSGSEKAVARRKAGVASPD